MTKNRTMPLVGFLVVCALGCNPKGKGESTDPVANTETPETATEGPTPDTPKEEAPPKAFDQAAVIGLIGSNINEAKVSSVFPGLQVAKEEETAEGDPTGNYFFRVRRGDATVAILHPDPKGVLGSVDFHSDYAAPGDTVPGKSTYKEADAALGIKSCFSGAEESGQYFRCSTTKHKGLSVTFLNNGRPERELSATQAAKELGETKVHWITVSE